MADRHRFRVGGIAALERNYRYAFFECAPAGPAECGAVVQPLEINADGAHALVSEQRFDTVGDVDHGLVACADRITERETLFDRGYAVEKGAAL